MPPTPSRSRPTEIGKSPAATPRGAGGDCWRQTAAMDLTAETDKEITIAGPDVELGPQELIEELATQDLIDGRGMQELIKEELIIAEPDVELAPREFINELATPELTTDEPRIHQLPVEEPVGGTSVAYTPMDFDSTPPDIRLIEEESVLRGSCLQE